MMTREGTDVRVQQNIIRNHFIFFKTSVWMYQGSQDCPISDFCPFKQCQAWAPSHGVGLKLNWRLVDYNPNSVSPLPQHISYRQG